LLRVIDRLIRPLRRGAEPGVPVEAGGNVGAFVGDLAEAVAGVDVNVNAIDRADGAGLNDLDDATVIVARVDLSADLRRFF